MPEQCADNVLVSHDPRGPLVAFLAAASIACASRPAPHEPVASVPAQYAVVLGVAQDGGYPQAGCRRADCIESFERPRRRRFVSSVAVVDAIEGKRWLIDATPDFKEQLSMLDRLTKWRDGPGIDGVFLTHAHVGHYAGLINLGREIMGTSGIPVYAMPRMKRFLETNGPWDQLIRLHNVEVQSLTAGVEVKLPGGIVMVPFLVPHRDEYSETVGYLISGRERRLLYIPDIDKWERWGRSIETALAEVDIALVDGTFFEDGELPGRNMSEIPHPFIRETMERLATIPAAEKGKVYFIHLNHTNPAMFRGPVRSEIERRGFHVAEQGMRIPL